MFARNNKGSYRFSALAAIVLVISAASVLFCIGDTIVLAERKSAENSLKEHADKRVVVTIVGGADGRLIGDDGDELKWGDLREMLEYLADKENAVLEVVFRSGIVSRGQNGNVDEWLSHNDVNKRAELLAQEQGLEYVGVLSRDNPSSQAGPLSIRTARQLVMDKGIPLELRTLQFRPLLTISTIEFNRLRGSLTARLRLSTISYPQRLWNIGVRLLDEEGRQIDSAGTNFGTNGKVGIFPRTSRDEIEIEFKRAGVQAGSRFEVTITEIIGMRKSLIAVEPKVYGSPAPSLYWTDSKSKRIQCWDPNEQRVKDLVVDEAGYINDIAIDQDRKKMYWTDSYQNVIRCANLDGSDIRNIITSGLSGPENIFFDSETNKIYWVDWMNDTVRRSNADGSNIEEIAAKNLSTPNGVTIDRDNRKLYLADAHGKGIHLCNLDGSDMRSLPIANLGYPRAITIDPDQRKIYWTDLYPSRIRRANLDGSGAEDVIVDSAAGPCIISIDTVDRKIYWTELGLGLIRRANLDGSDVEDIVSGLANPRGIRVYREKK